LFNRGVPYKPGQWLAYWIFILFFIAMAWGSIFYLPFHILRSYKEDTDFFASLFPEEGPSKCKNENCEHLSVKNSVLCATHHFEMVKNKPCPWRDKSIEKKD
jgi:hypothetical protein